MGDKEGWLWRGRIAGDYFFLFRLAKGLGQRSSLDSFDGRFSRLS